MLVVTDLDGTLLDSQSWLSTAGRDALLALGRAGAIRVVATGRSLYSALQVLERAAPIDYLVFAAGAGILSWADRELLVSHDMDPEDARTVIETLEAMRLDFMVHRAVPDNHHFFHRRAGSGPNADFDRRLGLYAAFAQPLGDSLPTGFRVSQVIAIQPPGVDCRIGALRRHLAELTVVRTTSPLDHRSRWIEIFSATVSKANASEWIRVRHGVRHDDVIAIGNDHNDTDLLAWAARSFVVANAAAELRDRYRQVPSNDDDGFAQLAGELLAESGRGPSGQPSPGLD